LAQVSLELIINGLTIAAGSALIVERFTEILKQVNDKVSQYLLAKDAEKSRQQRDDAAQRYLQSLADKARTLPYQTKVSNHKKYIALTHKNKPITHNKTE